MSHASGEAPTECQTNGWSSRLESSGLAREFPPKGLHGPDDLANTFHFYLIVRIAILSERPALKLHFSYS
jgi:hypothetical protein